MEIDEASEVNILVKKQDEFYDAQDQENIEAREYSEVIFLRKFNNWIKSVLINKYCNLSGPKPSIFDLCSGKGGDLPKWVRTNPSHYVALDFSG
jgi:mRNA (guanine-N7-)-methyltransferase